MKKGKPQKKPAPKTRGPSDIELREFASWAATYRTISESNFDWTRFGKLVENKARELFKPKCVECGK